MSESSPLSESGTVQDENDQVENVLKVFEQDITKRGRYYAHLRNDITRFKDNQNQGPIETHIIFTTYSKPFAAVSYLPGEKRTRKWGTITRYIHTTLHFENLTNNILLTGIHLLSISRQDSLVALDTLRSWIRLHTTSPLSLKISTLTRPMSLVKTEWSPWTNIKNFSASTKRSTYVIDVIPSVPIIRVRTLLCFRPRSLTRTKMSLVFHFQRNMMTSTLI